MVSFDEVRPAIPNLFFCDESIFCQSVKCLRIKKAYDQYLQSQGIDLAKPILLAGVTAKLDYKTWNEDRMAWTIQQFIKAYPQVQIIFNYAPGKEKENAYRIYEKMGKPQQVHIDIAAKSQRELVALSNRITLYFGNEVSARL